MFENNQNIPAKYSCNGENINPELDITGIPPEAKSLALIMHDPDAPRPGGFTHWLVWNIRPDMSSIHEASVPVGAVEGSNDRGKPGYTGPCPPPGAPHRYFFKLYALDSELDLPMSAGKQELESEIGKHKLATAELIGLFAR